MKQEQNINPNPEYKPPVGNAAPNKSVAAISVTVDCSVTDDTVRRCLQIVEWWLTDHPGSVLSGGDYRNEDGSFNPPRIILYNGEQL